MTNQTIDRSSALALLHEHTKSPSLIKHPLAVEAAMRHYANLFDEDPNLFGLVGLLHDFDYEENPTPPDHPLVGARILASAGYPEIVIEAIKSHASYLDITRDAKLKQTIFAVDELAGFITACTLILPSKKLADLTVQSIQKKLKKKEFARAINRQDILSGAKLLGLPLEAHIQHVLTALQNIAPDLGL